MSTLSDNFLFKYLPEKDRYLYSELVEASISHQLQKGYELLCIACISPQENARLIDAMRIWLATLMTYYEECGDDEKLSFVSEITKFTRDVIGKH